MHHKSLKFIVTYLSMFIISSCSILEIAKIKKFGIYFSSVCFQFFIIFISYWEIKTR
jgi:hypothetical protein